MTGTAPGACLVGLPFHRANWLFGVCWLGCREVEVMAAVGRHPFIAGILAACLEPPLAVVQVGG
jgi:hypothetical protein